MPHEERWWEREARERERGKELLKESERLQEERGTAYRNGQGNQYDKKHGIRLAGE